MSRQTASAFLLFALLFACNTAPDVQPPLPTEIQNPAITASSTLTVTPTTTSTPQPHLSPVTYGPELEDFPSGVNPLTGRVVADPSLLNLPAVLVSISNMPVTARPQAGPGFAPWIFELYIGEGTTRFLGIFYGEYPRTVPNINGGCEVRKAIIRRDEWVVGNRVWLDENENGRQDAWEVGIGGVCIRLLDASSHRVLAEASTDSNGYYAFDRRTAETVIQFIKPEAYSFTLANVGDEDSDSDADPNTGETQAFRAESTGSFWDAGLTGEAVSEEPIPTLTPVVTGTPPTWYIPSEPYVGPIR